MKTTVLILGIFLASPIIYADQNDMYADIAQEMLEAGKYDKAIEKCASVLEEDKTHKQCLEITKQARSHKQVVNNKAKAAAQKEAAENAKEAAIGQQHEAVLKSKSCRAAVAKYKFCEYSRYGRVTELQIQKEKKIGNETGVVNMKTLHNASEAKMNYETLATQENAKYKQLMGVDLNVPSCQLSDADFGNVKLPVNFYQDVKKLCELKEGEDVPNGN